MQAGAVCLRSQGAQGREATRFRGLEGLLVHTAIPPLPFTLSCISNCILLAPEEVVLGTAEVAAVTAVESVQGTLDTGGRGGQGAGALGAGFSGGRMLGRKRPSQPASRRDMEQGCMVWGRETRPSLYSCPTDPRGPSSFPRQSWRDQETETGRVRDNGRRRSEPGAFRDATGNAHTSPALRLLCRLISQLEHRGREAKRPTSDGPGQGG